MFNNTVVGIERLEYREELPNGRSHRGYKLLNPMDPQIADHGGVRVPKDSIWVMGDNRDFSKDSRYIGPVATNDVVGRGLYIYWSDVGGCVIKKVSSCP